MRTPKTLAAIVFTDVVGFSRHTNIDEARALAGFQRDLAIIREVCDRHHGIVLKTLGDGALMRFNSADNALSCALEIQRVIYAQSLTLEHRDILTHRIGVHLGDIMTTATDVFGDGVNVAARLQAEAKPGAIVLSRTVYDVVKGKVQFEANYLGPRQLKGIREPVTLWEVPSFGQQALQRRQNALEGMLPEEAPVGGPTAGFRGFPAAMIVIGCVVLLVAASYLVLRGMQGAKSQNDKEWAKRLQHAAAKRASNEPTRLADNSAASTAGTTTGTPTPPAQTDIDPFTDSAILAELAPLFAKNDFEGMATLVTTRAGTGPKAAAAARRYTQLSSYMDWLDTRLGTTSSDAPITIEHDPETGVQASFFRDKAGHLVRETATGQNFVDLDEVSKATLAALGTAALETTSSTTAGDAAGTAGNQEITSAIQILQEEIGRFNVGGSGSP